MTRRFLTLPFLCLAALAQAPADLPLTPLPTGNADIDRYNTNYIRLTRSLLAPKNVADTFGRRIAKRYIAMQITVANRNGDYQWMITDASLDLSRLIKYMQSESRCGTRAASLKAILAEQAKPVPNPTVTGSDLTILRGVAEKGQFQDPRNLTLRVLQGSGTIAASLLGVTTFGPAFAPAVAAFNGPLVSAYQRVFPDLTVNQLNRLNDSAYMANSIVNKQSPKVLVIFVPSSLLLDKSEQGKFYRDPYSVFSTGCTDLRLLDATVDGHFVTRLDVAPLISSVSIEGSEATKFGTDNFKVTGMITGRFLDGSTLALSGAPAGLVITPVGKVTEERRGFELSSPKPLTPSSAFTIEAQKSGSSAGRFAITANYSPGRPLIAAVGGVAPASVRQGEQAILEITGTNFLPDASVRFSNETGLTLGDVEYVATSKLRLTVAVAAGTSAGVREFVVQTAGGSTGKATIAVVQ